MPWTAPLLTLLLTSSSVGCSLSQTSLFDPDGDGVLVGNDCDDTDATIGVRYVDADADGHGSTAVFVPKTPGECTGSQSASASEDCNDADSSVHPGATEVCDRVDQDCNGQVDDAASDGLLYYEDADRDDYGNAQASRVACADQKPSGYVSNAEDCNDQDKDIHPGEVEVCDGTDQDCDTLIDEDPKDGSLYYPDGDQDGYGEAIKGERYCDSTAPSGWITTTGDCNDTDDASHPGAPETCDTRDNDCNGQVDDNPQDGQTYFVDADLDGYGDPSRTTRACTLSAGLSDSNQDCNDLSSSVYPGALEICNGRDEDCDGISDNGLPDTDASGFADCTEVAYITSVGFQENGEIQGCGTSTNLLAQQEAVAQVLLNIGLHLVPFQDDHVSGLDSAALLRYPLVMYDNGGWTDTLIPASVEALLAVRDAGKGLLFMGDDLVSQALAYNQNNGSRDLYGLLWVSQWKAGGTTQRGGVVLEVDHPVLSGPAGTVADFAYYGDMDVSISAGSGEVVLVNIFGSQNPAVLAAEQAGQKTVVMLPSLYSTVVNCPVSSSEGLVELETLFSNAMSWLIEW